MNTPEPQTPQPQPQHRFLVTWEIDDDDSTTPEQAARTALDILNDTRAGDPDGANCFRVTDRLRDQIHEIDLGGSDDDYTHLSHWPRPAGARLEPTLNETDAACMINSHGQATVRVRIDRGDYLDGYAEFAAGLIMPSEQITHHDKLHDLAFAFGYPNDAHDEIVAVDGTDFLVDYTTDLSDFL